MVNSMPTRLNSESADRLAIQRASQSESESVSRLRPKCELKRLCLVDQRRGVYAECHVFQFPA